MDHGAVVIRHGANQRSSGLFRADHQSPATFGREAGTNPRGLFSDVSDRIYPPVH